jgi:copper chaperone
MEDVDVVIGGMTCGGCVSAVRKALASAAGVRVVDVAVGRARLVVDAGPEVRSAIARALGDAGFSLVVYEAHRPSGSMPKAPPDG